MRAWTSSHPNPRASGTPPVAQPIWIQRSEVLRASNTGIFYATVERGHTVAQGTLLLVVVGAVAIFRWRSCQVPPWTDQ